MTGHSLREKEAHSAIHSAIEEQIEDTIGSLQKNEISFYHGVDMLLEIWENKVLGHAEEEENSLYKEKRSSTPSVSNRLNKLSRDHELLKTLTQRARSLARSPDIRDETIEESNAEWEGFPPIQPRQENKDEIISINKFLLMLLKIHSEEEERILWKGDLH